MRDRQREKARERDQERKRENMKEKRGFDRRNHSSNCEYFTKFKKCCKSLPVIMHLFNIHLYQFLPSLSSDQLLKIFLEKRSVAFYLKRKKKPDRSE